MRTTSKFLLISSMAVLATGCAKKSDYDAHVVKYQGLRDALVTWSTDVKNWESRTKNVICDIVEKTKVDYTYAPQTISYCPTGGTEGDGVPPDPPEFGQF